MSSLSRITYQVKEGDSLKLPRALRVCAGIAGSGAVVLASVFVYAVLQDREGADRIAREMTGDQVVGQLALIIFLLCGTVVLGVLLATTKLRLRAAKLEKPSSGHLDLRVARRLAKRDVEAARAEMLREFEAWKLNEISRLYEQVMDQQRRGILRVDGDRCPSCRNRNDLAS
ncbi:hypothetical protein ACWF76_29180 [Streptomyces globisporus]